MRSANSSVRSGAQLQHSDKIDVVQVTIYEKDTPPRLETFTPGQITLAESGTDGWVSLSDGRTIEGDVEFLVNKIGEETVFPVPMNTNNFGYKGETVIESAERFVPSQYGHSRSGSCGCGWNPALHGDICPEHGTNALTEPKKSVPLTVLQPRALTDLANAMPPLGWSTGGYVTLEDVMDPLNPAGKPTRSVRAAIIRDSKGRAVNLDLDAAIAAELEPVGSEMSPVMLAAAMDEAAKIIENRVKFIEPPNLFPAMASHEQAKTYHHDNLHSVPEGFAPQVIDTVRNRGSDYGTPSENHQLTADLWTAWLRRRLRLDFVLTAEDVIMLNVLQKESRLAFKTKNDSWLDVAGYTENVAMLKEEQRNG